MMEVCHKHVDARVLTDTSKQTLYNAVNDIAADFSDPKYQQAAQRFRLPYWDYLKPREHKTTTFNGAGGSGTTSFPYNFDLPLVLTVDQVMVYQPQAEGGNETQLVPIPNPLLTFYFPAKDSVTPREWSLLNSQDDQVRVTRCCTTNFADSV